MSYTSSRSEHGALRPGRTEQAVSNGLELPRQTAVSTSQFNQHIHQTGARLHGSLMDAQERQANNDQSQTSLQDLLLFGRRFSSDGHAKDQDRRVYDVSM